MALADSLLAKILSNSFGFREWLVAIFPTCTTCNLQWKGDPHMIAKIKLFLIDDNGATAIEYGLIAAGISVAIITVVPAVGGKLNTAFGKVSAALN